MSSGAVSSDTPSLSDDKVEEAAAYLRLIPSPHGRSKIWELAKCAITSSQDSESRGN
ncbi:hypothetical protein JG687_00013994 [Phytophthora cactorum]|uniref:Uncharacterized protein n=1 Tax=Phytophthora cactorum TaxID=29920 RepID=A0A329RJ16_9STRA|nr:hypothetical protein Pcac1_g7421 [Phytophthora cactorum]KAG2802353.1 hypothetical protein PC111_g19139 [Phytophthora cactorum]KAG2803103.1 hypothetical protein PC112_g19327 [Phytophthora cactorum]KAG2838414.1 hypothetical protein PC113_g19667 [Phytophthora cactorum]KAG2882379.1 hypothetical protein PC114_g21082 [Phytophthora cactorum]